MKSAFIKLFLVTALLCPLTGLSQATIGYHRVGQVLAKGNGVNAVVVPYATVTVTSAVDGTAAVIYSDPLLSSQISPPVITADGSGNYSYYIPINYLTTETITSPGQGSFTVSNVGIVSSGSGTVNPGSAGQIAYYPSTGSAVSGESVSSLGAVVLDPSISQPAIQPLGTTLSVTNLNDVFWVDGYLGITATGGSPYASGTYAKWTVVTYSGSTYVSMVDGNTTSPATATGVCGVSTNSTGTCYWFVVDSAVTITTPTTCLSAPDFAEMDATAWIQTSNEDAVIEFGEGPMSATFYTTCLGLAHSKIQNRGITSFIGTGSGGINSSTYIHVAGGTTINRAVLYTPPSDNSNDYLSIKDSGLAFYIGGGRASSCASYNGIQHSLIEDLYFSGAPSGSAGELGCFNVGVNSSSLYGGYENKFVNIKVQAMGAEPSSYATINLTSCAITNTTITGSGGTATLTTANTSACPTGSVVFVGGLTAGACLNNGGSVDGNGYTVGTVVTNTSIQITAPAGCSAVGSTADAGSATVYTVVSGGAGYTSTLPPFGVQESATGGFYVAHNMTQATGLSANISSGAVNYVTVTTAPILPATTVTANAPVVMMNNSVFPDGYYWGNGTDNVSEDIVLQGATNNACMETGAWPWDHRHAHCYADNAVDFEDYGGTTYEGGTQIDTLMYIGFYTHSANNGSHSTVSGGIKVSNVSKWKNQYLFLVGFGSDPYFEGGINCSSNGSYAWTKIATDGVTNGGAVKYGTQSGYYFTDLTDGTCDTTTSPQADVSTMVTPASNIYPWKAYITPLQSGRCANSTYACYNVSGSDSTTNLFEWDNAQSQVAAISRGGGITGASLTDTGLTTANAIPKNSSAGLLSESSLTDNGTTVATTEAASTGALTAPSETINGNIIQTAGNLSYWAASGGSLAVNGLLSQPPASTANSGTPNVASGSYITYDSLWNGSAAVTEAWALTPFQSVTGLAGNSNLTLQFQPATGFTGTSQFVIATNQGATSSNNYAAPGLSFKGSEWSGSAPTADIWNIAFVLGSGSNPTSALTFTHTGSGGAASVNFGSFPLAAGAINGVTLASGGKIVYTGTGTYTTATSDTFTVTGATASSNCVPGPTNATAAAATVQAYISSVSTNSVTVSHVATTASGGTINIHCTAN
jgi:hypothetical protein